MRLGQLARQLNINTADIVSLLNENDIIINDHPNVKIDGEPEQIVLRKFGQEAQQEKVEIEVLPEVTQVEEPAPTSITELNEPSSMEEKPITIEEGQVTFDQEVEKSPYQQVVEEKVEQLDVNLPKADEDNQENLEPSIDPSIEEINELNLNIDEDEVIRAPKISLEGLKVVGKIDLPEPKSKEEIHKEKDDTKAKRKSKNYRSEQTEEEKEARRIRNREIKERRLQKEKEREQQEREERERKAKEEFYRKKLVTEKAALKNKKAKRKEIKKQDEHIIKSKPKSALGKFWQWLNT
ncbi:MAG: hypothetical protein RIA69_05545 [Cyclobacteriaceae bacterium]